MARTINKNIRASIVIIASTLPRYWACRLAVGEKRMDIRLLFPALAQTYFCVFKSRIGPCRCWRCGLPARTWVERVILALSSRMQKPRCSRRLHAATADGQS